MDLVPEELQLVGSVEIVRESISIPRHSPRNFYLISLTLIFPLSFAILAHSLFTHPILVQLNNPFADPSQTQHEWTLLLAFQFCYLLFLFGFSLVSTAAVVFTVASLYTASPCPFSSTLSAIPRVFRRLLVTFLWVSLLMLSYNLLFLSLLLLLIVAVDTHSALLLLLSLLLLFLLFLVLHVYITALWHLASVVSVLEPDAYGFAAMKKSYQLLRGRTRLAFLLVFAYFAACGLIGTIFSGVVVHGEDHYSTTTKILVGGSLLVLMVGVNLVGLLVQSVFYYVCKSFHHQGIDKAALHDHLGAYLGDYVSLKSNIQMENFDI